MFSDAAKYKSRTPPQKEEATVPSLNTIILKQKFQKHFEH